MKSAKQMVNSCLGESVKSYKGSCLCSAVKFQISGNLENFYLCHCRHCQKDTGSAFAANLFSTSATLKWLTGRHAITVYRHTDTRHQKCFCKVCGSALPFMQFDNTVTIPAGCLDTKPSIKPTAHIFTESKAEWDTELGTLLKYKRLPE